MDVSEQLDELRNKVAGCILVAYTDLGSKLVLSSSAAARPAQEDLDRLSNLAQIMLDGSVAEGAAPAITAEGHPGQAGLAMLLSGSDAKVFLRARDSANEALVCVCTPESDLKKVVDCGRSTLNDIVGTA